MTIDEPSLVTLETSVLVVGGGPVGLLTAFQLSRLGIRCIIAERNLETTTWPKMDLMNCRTMEILKILGLADEFRQAQGVVGPDGNFHDVYHTGMSPGGKVISTCSIPTVNQWRELIASDNDGSHPREPAQRCSQVIFEAWMKQKCLEQALIDFRGGLTFEDCTEDDNGVTATFIDQSSQKVRIRSKYMAGCDGARSQVRRHLGIKMLGGQPGISMYLVHFKSKELGERQPLGPFWHAISFGVGAVINQDDKDTFSTNMYMPPSTNFAQMGPREVVHRVMGTDQIKIDEVINMSHWKVRFSVAERWMSEKQKVLLAGDAAHTIPPWGGYGFNSGVEDSYGLAWRLAAMLNGYGGGHLLPSYEVEMMPVIVTRMRTSESFVQRSMAAVTMALSNPELLTADTEEGSALRKDVGTRIESQGSMHANHGIELDSRHKSAIIFGDQEGSIEPNFDPKSYTPSTWPGARAPHVFLRDGHTSSVDLYGTGFTLFDFTASAQNASISGQIFRTVAESLQLPLTVVNLQEEEDVHRIWERNLVLVRPDGHVAWRSNGQLKDQEQAFEILKVVIGQTPFPGYVPSKPVSWEIVAISEASSV